MSSKNWFLVQFKPNSHFKAERNLSNQGFDTFLPLHEVTCRKASKFHKIIRPLFPGYMFVSNDQSIVSWSKINSTIGVSRIITFNSKPTPIPTTLILKLKKRCNELGILTPNPKLREGDKVKIIIGPFTDYVATVEALEENQRIWVLVDLMGQKSRMQITTNKLKAIN